MFARRSGADCGQILEPSACTCLFTESMMMIDDRPASEMDGRVMSPSDCVSRRTITNEYTNVAVQLWVRSQSGICQDKFQIPGRQPRRRKKCLFENSLILHYYQKVVGTDGIWGIEKSSINATASSRSLPPLALRMNNYALMPYHNATKALPKPPNPPPPYAAGNLFKSPLPSPNHSLFTTLSRSSNNFL